MIFYGTKPTNIKNDRILNINCPNCNSNTSMKYSVFESYAHVYWIPLFPVKRLTFLECDSCKKTFEDKELATIDFQKLSSINKKIKSPFWMFSGLMIIGFIMLMVYYNSIQTSNNSKNFIQNPKIGDVYLIDDSNGFYSTLKLNKISKDSLTLLVNNMAIDDKTETDKIDLEKNYVQKQVIAKKDLQKLFKENKIYEVVRH
ncbi:zinc-ribbon domain-containing protein [Flavobacterium sp.]|uniref:zinc-ribbon domain-containing protein n=1 Tax=Flavobacterium sp. TaxID=239 RepID=UPI002ED967A2